MAITTKIRTHHTPTIAAARGPPAASGRGLVGERGSSSRSARFGRSSVTVNSSQSGGPSFKERQRIWSNRASCAPGRPRTSARVPYAPSLPGARTALRRGTNRWDETTERGTRTNDGRRTGRRNPSPSPHRSWGLKPSCIPGQQRFRREPRRRCVRHRQQSRDPSRPRRPENKRRSRPKAEHSLRGLGALSHVSPPPCAEEPARTSRNPSIAHLEISASIRRRQEQSMNI